MPLKLSIARKILLATGLALFLGVSLLSLGSILYQQEHLVDELTADGSRLGETIRLGVRNAMMLNSRNELNQIVQDVAWQKNIETLRIYNKDGTIMFSGHLTEVGTIAGKNQEACLPCHRTQPPAENLSLEERTSVFIGKDGQRMLRVIVPIMNEHGCTIPPCHFHPEDKKILGTLEVVLPLTTAENDVLNFQLRVLALAAGIFILGGAGVHFFLNRCLTKPIEKLIEGTRVVARGQVPDLSCVTQNDEIGELAHSISSMAQNIIDNQTALNQQRDEYQRLFDQVPCFITVQDKDLRLLRYNQQFREQFNPTPGDFCYSAYKGRATKCLHCAVKKTLETGLSHCSEESSTNPDGSRTHWLVHTSPVFDTDGNAIAAMEMSLDITLRKELEERLRRSELKYLAIFNNIPNAVFVMDLETFQILDCNSKAESLYNLSREQLLGKSFLHFFLEEEREQYASQLQAFTVLNRVLQHTADGKPFNADIMLSPSDYQGKAVLLLTVNDISERLEAEQKLFQASKMATLGEMSTGVAHELNQPLTVIKTASGFLLRKVQAKATIDADILETLAKEIDSHVDRASKIIEHMRDFGRRADIHLDRVNVNDVIHVATEFFNRQLSQRGIQLIWDVPNDLPPIMAIANHIEQALINLLLNARDAIEERAEKDPNTPKRITIKTFLEDHCVHIQVVDTGNGIPKALIPRLFEPFFTTKKVGKGTGLGLSIIYGLIKNFGGSITAENKNADDPDGSGAVFTMRFPITGNKQ